MRKLVSAIGLLSSISSAADDMWMVEIERREREEMRKQREAMQRELESLRWDIEDGIR